MMRQLRPPLEAGVGPQRRAAGRLRGQHRSKIPGDGDEGDWMSGEGYDFDWLVVGSGFGGSVSALRLAEKGYSVGVLECGRRFEDHEFARNTADARGTVYWAVRKQQTRCAEQIRNESRVLDTLVGQLRQRLETILPPQPPPQPEGAKDA